MMINSFLNLQSKKDLTVPLSIFIGKPNSSLYRFGTRTAITSIPARTYRALACFRIGSEITKTNF